MFDGTFELDELYWFIGKKARTKTRENVYVMTMISREPRQIQAFRVVREKCTQPMTEYVDYENLKQLAHGQDDECPEPLFDLLGG